MIIIGYRNIHDIDIKFESGYIAKNVQYANFKKGTIKDRFQPSFLNKGYMGDGKYVSKIKGERTVAYQKWRAMLSRCYSKTRPETYKDCIVCDEWLNFQNFAQWIEDNYYEIEDEKIELDKDILIKGNKIYSPETCLLVPKRLNDVILNRSNDRSKVYIGVYKHGEKYIASCNSIDRNRSYIGTYDTKEDAFHAYKNFKENEIKNIANIYKDKIPEKVYNAIISYKIEKTD